MGDFMKLMISEGVRKDNTEHYVCDTDLITIEGKMSDEAC